MKVLPVRCVKGRIRLPGDKSISHRVALIAALAKGRSEITNFSSSRDCASTLSCIELLGSTIMQSGDILTIDPPEHFRAPEKPLDCGNSGSTMRMLAGILAGRHFASQLIGDDSLSSRPMGRIIEPLQLMGARIESTAGRPPLRIHGVSSLSPITYELPVASAQVKSSIMFAALDAHGSTTVIESQPTRDHTEKLFRGFGVDVGVSKHERSRSISINGPARLEGGKMAIPGDISSAAYFVAASMLLPDSDLIIEKISLNETRTQFLSLLGQWGCDIETTIVASERNELLGNITVRTMASFKHKDSRRRIVGELVPGLIDELPLLAVVGTQMAGGLEIRDAGELRVKETDRISATVENLRVMGAEVKEYEDGLFVQGPTKLKGALIQSFMDHRIAMAFSIAALIAEGESEIVDSSCVGISFPEFFELLDQVVQS